MGLANNSTSQYITSLINAGSDAMKNLYYLEFKSGVLENASQSLKVRTQDFKPPTASQGVHTVNFMTVGVDMPTAEINLDKTLSFSFRLDENYNLYKFLLAQQSTTFNGNLGYAINRVPDDSDQTYGFTIKAYIYDRTLGDSIDDESNYRNMYTFRYCWIPSISGLQYSYDSANVLTLSATVKFWDMDDLMNTLLS